MRPLVEGSWMLRGTTRQTLESVFPPFFVFVLWKIAVEDCCGRFWHKMTNALHSCYSFYFRVLTLRFDFIGAKDSVYFGALKLSGLGYSCARTPRAFVPEFGATKRRSFIHDDKCLAQRFGLIGAENTYTIPVQTMDEQHAQSHTLDSTLHCYYTTLLLMYTTQLLQSVY